MDNKLMQDIDRLFAVYLSRSADLQKHLTPAQRAEFLEEADLLRISVLNRLKESADQ